MGTLRGCPRMLWVLLRAAGEIPAAPREQSQFLCLWASPATRGSLWEAVVCSQVSFLPVPTPATITIHHLCLQTPDKTILYSVATTLVNCTNSYDVKEVIPELVQLAKFSKQHVPEEHPKVGMRMAESGRGLSTPDHQRGGTES